jgi:hypothetical protein
MEEEWEEKGVLSERCEVQEDGNEITYYVPKSYDVWSDTLKVRDKESREDVNACLPTVEFDKKVGKWRFDFTSGGYDVQPFSYYFDDLNDLLDMMQFPARCDCKN